MICATRAFSTACSENRNVSMRRRKRLAQLTGPVRGEMGHRLGLRYVPEIDFAYDDSAAYAAHIQEVIEKIHREEKS